MSQRQHLVLGCGGAGVVAAELECAVHCAAGAWCWRRHGLTRSTPSTSTVQRRARPRVRTRRWAPAAPGRAGTCRLPACKEPVSYVCGGRGC